MLKLTDIINVTHLHCAPAGAAYEGPSVSDKPIEILIDNLRESGIEIIKDMSEKDIRYRLGEKQKAVYKTTTVPISTVFEGYNELRALRLKAEKGIELHIQNHSDLSNSAPPGTMGGTVSGDIGIRCEFLMQGKHTNISFVNSARTALEKTYRQPSSVSSLITNLKNK